MVHTEPQILGAAAVDPFRQAIDALSDLDVELVVTTHAEQLEALGPLAPGTRKLATMPLNLILLPLTKLLADARSESFAIARCTGERRQRNVQRVRQQ